MSTWQREWLLRSNFLPSMLRKEHCSSTVLSLAMKREFITTHRQPRGNLWCGSIVISLRQTNSNKNCLALGGQRFNSNDEVMKFTRNFLSNLDTLSYYAGLEKLVLHYDKCLNCCGNYVEK